MSSRPTRRSASCAAVFIVATLGVVAPGGVGVGAEECAPETPAACVEAGAALEGSHATPADREQAVVQYRRACSWGHAPGCVLAGHRLRNGKDVAHDPTAAVDLFRTACDSGSFEGCNMLGIMHAEGEGGLAADLVRARQLYGRSCAGGWGWGCYNLALRMRDGEGGDHDLAGAAASFEKACDAAIASACNGLGNLYWEGKGVAKDRLRANTFYTRGCDGGHGWACYNLATSYRSGEGVPAEDPGRAIPLLRKACGLDVARACNLAGIMYHDAEVEEDLLLAFGLFHRACDDGYSWGCHNMAKMYRDGRGIGQDAERARALFRAACDGGIAESCEAIGAPSPAAVTQAAPTPPPTATPRPTATPAPRPTPRPASPPPAPPATRWQRNCQVVWRSSHELVYTATTQVTDGADGEASLHARRRDLLGLVQELDVTGEPELERTLKAAVRAVEQAPVWDDPMPSFLGRSSADMTITPGVSSALSDLWELVGRRAKAAGEPCAHLRFKTGEDGVMLDTETGLEWLAGPDERLTRDQAVAWVKSMSGSGWRLPTKLELLGLHEGGVGVENLAAYTGISGSWVWAESETAGQVESWGFSFARRGSMVMTSCKFCDSRALAVRTGR